jgi:superfamily II DNA or RNA helicase
MLVLKDYQTRAIERWVKERRAFVAYPTGSGKTLVAIMGIRAINVNMAPAPLAALIICPAKVVPQWRKELVKYDVAAEVTSYQMLKKLPYKQYDVVVVDEAHHIKNRKSDISRNVAFICQTAKYVMMLSATPSPNRPADVWHPLHILFGYSVGSWTAFIEKYCECTYWGDIPTPGKLKREMREEFSAFVAKHMCLESAGNILDLPDVRYELTDSAPLKNALYFTWERQKAICFALQHGILFVHGGQTIKRRMQLITAAIEQNQPIVCTVDSIGEGIDSLQHYDRAVFLELVWSPGKLVQAIGRIVRLGSKHDSVTVEFVAPKGTRQERMSYLLKQKLVDNAAIYGDEDATKVANDILGGEMTDAQFDSMWEQAAAHANSLPDFGF